MNFSREQIEAIAALPDEKMWVEVRRIASSFGFTLPVECPPHKDLEKLREMALGNKISPADAMRLVNTYKRGMKK
ncbi:MAG: hypothetical protein IJX92_05540 [Clostridia bacterium]|nr:hypothetical protein [Clostridia bacterium]